jgi:SlyX protein
MENRITDLEIRITHQEAALDEMNGVLLEQHQLIQKLRDELAHLQHQLRGMNTSNVADAADETPPPHY